VGRRCVANQEIARRCQVTPDAVRRWRTRFAEQGVDGVGKIAKDRGCKSPRTEGTVADIVRVTCQEKPDDGGTHWTTRLLAKRFGLGKDTIAKVWTDHNLKPWKVSTFKVPNAPPLLPRRVRLALWSLGLGIVCGMPLLRSRLRLAREL
jgi:hypothetical protein